MRTYLDCIPCFMYQALRAARLVGLPDSETMDLLAELGGRIREISMDDPPPKTAISVYSLISKYSGKYDPFEELKSQGTRAALSLYPALKNRVERSDDPLALSIRLAVLGNVIDFGVSSSFDLEHELSGLFEHPLGIWHEEVFRNRLAEASWILYIGDNTGETVFDRLLIETLEMPVTYVVRGGPIINDVTMDDALAAGLDKVCKGIVSSGCRAPGIILDQCSEEFLDLFRSAPMIISKGQGNLETLSGIDAPVFYLLKAKCQVVAGHLRVRQGDFLLVDSSTVSDRDTW